MVATEKEILDNMPRPRCKRRIAKDPKVLFYKPQGVPLCDLVTIELQKDEWESLRLKNIKELNQTEAAEKMGISQSTFQRIYQSAQIKISTAIVEGNAIKIIK